MSNSDAEWIDIDNSTPRTNRPQTTTTFRSILTDPPPIIPTFRPRLPRPNGRRPRRPFRPGNDAPEVSSSYQAMTISLSVISVLFFVFLILLLIYLFVVKKKLRKVQRSESNSQFCLRVEDVSHLDMNDSSHMYVNTTDLHKLVSSVRLKNKKRPPMPPPAIPTRDPFPDVIQVGRPPFIPPNNNLLHNSNNELSNINNHEVVYDNPCDIISANISKQNNLHHSSNNELSNSKSNEVVYDNSSCIINANISTEVISSPIITRAAPPPPVKGFNINKNSQENTSTNILRKPILPPKDFFSTNQNKPINSNTKLKTLVKPDGDKNIDSNISKPLSSNLVSRPLLPPLKMNMLINRKSLESGLSTPDTAISYVTDTETPEPKMSVKAKKAMLEDAIAKSIIGKRT